MLPSPSKARGRSIPVLALNGSPVSGASQGVRQRSTVANDSQTLKGVVPEKDGSMCLGNHILLF
jgi:hypothetical protein